MNESANIDSLLADARAAEADGDVARALQCLEKVVELVPTHALAWTWVGTLLADREQFAAAEEAFERGISLDPTLAGAYSGLGSVFASTGRIAEAERAYERSIAIAPTTSRYVLLADVCIRLGKDTAAEKALLEAIRLESDNEEALLNLALLFRPTRGTEALALLRKAAAIDPLDAIVARELGFELARAGKLEEAEHYLQTSATIDASSPWTHLYLANLYTLQGRRAEAENEHEIAVRCAPLSGYPLQQLATFYEAEGKYEQALQILRRAAAVDPSDAEAAYLLGRCLVQHGERDEGYTWLDKALTLDPNHQAALRMRESG